LVALSELFLCT